MLAAFALVSCSSDDVVNEASLPMNPDGTTYLFVKIAADRGTRGQDAGFEYGKAYEHAVTSADFYFYDADGAYVATAQVWNGGSENLNRPDENIEYFGNNVIVLKGLTEKTFPKYLVTVLNQPEDFVPGDNLKDMETKLTSVLNRTVSGKITNFVMSTTSYGRGAEGNDVNGQPAYFTTEVKPADFQKDPTALNNVTPVEIYVERLAAKVNVDTDNSTLVPVEGLENTYELKVSVAGDPNAEDNDDNIGAEVVRVKFEGWGLNATAKETHIVKNINVDWSLGNFVWNEPENFRSLWGMGTAYGKDLDENGTYGSLLNYNTWTQLSKVGFGKDAYCGENTNVASILNSNIGVAATSVVVAATILHQDKDGNWVSPNMIRFNGMLFTEANFKAYALRNLNTLGQLNYYRKTSVYGEDGTTVVRIEYNQLNADDVEVVNSTEGDNSVVKLALTTAAKATDWYQKNADGTYSETPIRTELTALSKFSGNGYKGGKMYYNIPIQHLYEDAAEGIQEGEYGVVRNHYYKLTITSLEKLGTGVWNPDGSEWPIVPPPTPDPDYYQLGAKINILSWRVVDQTVGL